MKSVYHLAVLLGAAAASGLDLAETAAKPVAFCSTVDKIVTSKTAQVAATAFCQSYLSLTTVTTSTATATTTVTNACSPPPNAQHKRAVGTKKESKMKRDLEARRKPLPPSKPKPSCLSTYSAGQLLSSACSCLSVPVSTSTVTTTSTTTTYVGTPDPKPRRFKLVDGSGAYAHELQSGGSNSGKISFSGGPADATVFSIVNPGVGGYGALKTGSHSAQVKILSSSSDVANELAGAVNFFHGSQALSCTQGPGTSGCLIYCDVNGAGGSGGHQPREQCVMGPQHIWTFSGPSAPACSSCDCHVDGQFIVVGSSVFSSTT